MSLSWVKLRKRFPKCRTRCLVSDSCNEEKVTHKVHIFGLPALYTKLTRSKQAYVVCFPEHFVYYTLPDQLRLRDSLVFRGNQHLQRVYPSNILTEGPIRSDFVFTSSLSQTDSDELGIDAQITDVWPL